MTEKPQSLAALKRYLKPGKVLMLTEHELGGRGQLPVRREIVNAQPSRIEMSAWPGDDPSRTSSLHWPPASSIMLDDKGFVVNDGIRMRYEYVDPCPHGDETCPCPEGGACHYVAIADTRALPCPRTEIEGCTACN